MTCDMQFRSFQKNPYNLKQKHYPIYLHKLNLTKLLHTYYQPTFNHNGQMGIFFVKATGLYSKKIGKN